MTLFTDNPFEKIDDTKTLRAARQCAARSQTPRPCASCPYRAQSPCIGYCLKQVQEKPPKETRTAPER